MGFRTSLSFTNSNALIGQMNNGNEYLIRWQLWGNRGMHVPSKGGDTDLLLCPAPHSYVEVLPSRTYWSYLEIGLLQRLLVKIILGWAPSPIRFVSLQKGEMWTQTCTQEEHHVSIKAEIRVMDQGTPKISSEPLEVRRKAWNRFSRTANRRNHPCQYLDLRLLAFKSPSLWYFVMTDLGN